MRQALPPIIAFLLLVGACSQPCPPAGTPPAQTRVEYRTRTIYQTVVICPGGLAVHYSGTDGHVDQVRIDELCATTGGS